MGAAAASGALNPDTFSDASEFWELPAEAGLIHQKSDRIVGNAAMRSVGLVAGALLQRSEQRHSQNSHLLSTIY